MPRLPNYKHVVIAKPVSCFDKEGNLIERFHSIGEASRKTKVNKSEIQRVCGNSKRLNKSAGGYQWSFIEALKIPKLSGKKGKPVFCFDMIGRIIKKYETILGAEKDTGVANASIIRVCRGKSMSAGDYLWSYTDTPRLPVYNVRPNAKPIVCFDVNGNFIARYESIYKATKETKIYKASITRVCKDRQKTAGGYIWKYA